MSDPRSWKPWRPDLSAEIVHHIGPLARELRLSDDGGGSPALLRLTNGDVGVIGWDATDNYADRLPAGVAVNANERLVIVPKQMWDGNEGQGGASFVAP